MKSFHLTLQGRVPLDLSYERLLKYSHVRKGCLIGAEAIPQFMGRVTLCLRFSFSSHLKQRSSDVPGGSSQGKAVCSEAGVSSSFRPQLPERNREMATQTHAWLNTQWRRLWERHICQTFGGVKSSRLNLTDYASEDRIDVMIFTWHKWLNWFFDVKEVELTLNPDTTKNKRWSQEREWCMSEVARKPWSLNPDRNGIAQGVLFKYRHWD